MAHRCMCSRRSGGWVWVPGGRWRWRVIRRKNGRSIWRLGWYGWVGLYLPLKNLKTLHRTVSNASQRESVKTQGFLSLTPHSRLSLLTHCLSSDSTVCLFFYFPYFSNSILSMPISFFTTLTLSLVSLTFLLPVRWGCSTSFCQNSHPTQSFTNTTLTIKA